MTQALGETTLMLHGLEVENGVVRADVFASKLRTLVKSLVEADRFANGGKARHQYMLTDLRIGSAVATVREKIIRRERELVSGMETYKAVTATIYNGEHIAGRFPNSLVKSVRTLAMGSAKKFAHGELEFADNVIRIDDFLKKQADLAALEAKGMPQGKEAFYRGSAIGRFDGLLKAIDSRGTMLRGKLILTAGGREIDCVMHKDDIPVARECFDRRVTIDGIAHYDGQEQLPVRIDVKKIIPLDGGADFLRWRGAFKPLMEDTEEGEW